MFASWTLAGSSQTHTEIEFDNDPRLAVALGAVLEQSACRLGMSDESVRVLNAAVQEACRNVWRSLNGTNEKLHLDCEEFSDRLELTFRCSGVSRSEIEACAAALKPKVDQVNIETRSGKPHLKLVKFAGRR